MKQLNYQLTKQNYSVFKLGTVLLLNRFGFKKIAFGPGKLSGLSRNGLFPASHRSNNHKCPGNVVEMKEAMAAFLAVTALQFLANVREKIILV